MKKINYFILKNKISYIFIEPVKGYLFREEYGVHRNSKNEIIITDLATGFEVAYGVNTVEAYKMFNNRLDFIKIERNKREYKLNKELMTACVKQQPSKPIKAVLGKKAKIGRLNFGKGCTVYKCPVCNSFVGYLRHYCSDCGQHIDWSETLNEN